MITILLKNLWLKIKTYQYNSVLEPVGYQIIAKTTRMSISTTRPDSTESQVFAPHIDVQNQNANTTEITEKNDQQCIL